MNRAAQIIRLILIAAILLSVPACGGYKYSSTFFIRNVSDAAITVIAAGGNSGDSSFELRRGEQRSVHIEYTRCPEGFVPVDKYTPDDPIPPAKMLGSLEIRADGKLLDDAVRMRRNWERRATEYSEVYTLNIDEGLIGLYGGGL